MHAFLAKRIEIPWLKPQPVIVWLALVVISYMAWRSSVVEVNGIYPDWDDDVGNLLGFFIREVLICAWSAWIVSLIFKSRRFLFWFRFGACFALCFGLVRLLFVGEIIKLFRL